MLDEKDLEQIAEIVSRVKESNDKPDGCGIVAAGIVIMLAIFGAFCLGREIFI